MITHAEPGRQERLRAARLRSPARNAALAFALGVTLATAGCDVLGDKDDPLPVALELEAPAARVQTVHVIANAPELNVLLEGEPVVSDLGFLSATGFRDVESGTAALAVDALAAEGTVGVIPPLSVALESNQRYLIAAIGSLATAEPLIIGKESGEIGDGNLRMQVAHAALGMPTLDLYLYDPCNAAERGSPLASLAYGESMDTAVEVPASDCTFIEIVSPNSPGELIYSASTVSLGEGLDLTGIIFPNTSVGESPISILAVDAAGLSPPFEVLGDSERTSLTRVMHLAPDLPALSVVACRGLESCSDAFEVARFEGVEYGQLTDPFQPPIVVPAIFPPPPVTGSEQFRTLVTVSPANNDGVILNNNGLGDELITTSRSTYTVFVTGLFNNADLQLVQTEDVNTRRIATDALFRMFHGSPGAGTVDLYLRSFGADSPSDTPWSAAVPFRADTGYLRIPPGAYELWVTAEGSTEVLIPPTALDLSAGGRYTAVVVDALGGGPPLSLFLTDDFAAPTE